MKKWIFVIDTDEYAGNFERQLCAYVTGTIGDCGVGEEFATYYLEDTGEEETRFYDKIEQRADDHGCNRPCLIWERPPENKENLNGQKYTSVAIFFEKKPTKKDIELIKERSLKFADVTRKTAKIRRREWDYNFKLNIIGFRLLEEETTRKTLPLN